jgi:hypothetical protein
MSSHPSSPHSSRLGNLSLGAQGAAFELDGSPVRLDSGGYAAPVASLQEFYHQALADFYQRSAEITRQQAAARPPLLGRLLSWIGGLFGRAPSPAPGVSHPHPAPPVLALPSPRAPAEPARHAPEPPPTLKSPEADRGMKPAMDRSAAPPPLLHVVFADRDGVHVIWQLTSAKPEVTSASRDPAGSKAEAPRLELTYRLDSTLAQRLQDCYGQLTQLGYKVAGLEAVQAAPEKPAAGKKPPRPSPEAPSPAAPAAVAEKPAAEIPKATEPKPSPRKPRPEGTPVRTEPEKPGSEHPSRDPSFLPGM